MIFKRLGYWPIKKLLQFFFLFYSVEVEGIENIPRKGSAILAANHSSFLDAMIMYRVINRHFHAVAAKWLFKIWFVYPALWAADCVPTNGSAQGALHVLMKGDMILIFPEGKCRISKEESSPICHKGVALFALKTGAPVIPIGVKGTFEAWPQTRCYPHFFKKIKVSIGKPMSFEKYTADDKIPDELMIKTLEPIMCRIYELADLDTAALKSRLAVS